jgi:hypothetical protein
VEESANCRFFSAMFDSTPYFGVKLKLKFKLFGKFA